MRINNEMPLITRETAKEFSARGNAARWSKPRPEKEPARTESVPETNNHDLTRSIKRLEHQLSLIDDQLDRAKEPAAWRDLTTARMRLFDQWCVLKGIHKPGPSKPPREPTRRFQAVVLPMEEPAQIAPLVASTPQQVVPSPLVASSEIPQDASR